MLISRVSCAVVPNVAPVYGDHCKRDAIIKGYKRI